MVRVVVTVLMVVRVTRRVRLGAVTGADSASPGGRLPLDTVTVGSARPVARLMVWL